MDKKLEELKSYEKRLEVDISRSRNMDSHGLSTHSPLMQNLRQVKKDIANFVEPTNEQINELKDTSAAAAGGSNKKIVVNSVEHMSHSLHDHHVFGGRLDYNGRVANHPYTIHHMGMDKAAEADKLGATAMSPQVHNYMVLSGGSGMSGDKEAHHFKVSTRYSPEKATISHSTSNLTHDVKHVGKVM